MVSLPQTQLELLTFQLECLPFREYFYLLAIVGEHSSSSFKVSCAKPDSETKSQIIELFIPQALWHSDLSILASLLQIRVPLH